ncbi:hypothetical protein [Propionispora hippei]|uniref:Membrane protein YjdF n=1 Tax=Propionispora hippei DSM 15287 TaxID=1123003 RepID=A0A1M6IFV4_9FIRM|nr:hypothetical protein [Propionispora hippei]SHJ33305.1 hypothetical protein SAMN02745170_02295 [Propionispora hippei DSM 15287]
MGEHARVRLILTSGCILAQILVMLGMAGQENWEFMRGAAWGAILLLAYTLWEIKCRLYMNNYVRALIVITVVADSYIGGYLGYYMTSQIFDKALHLFGTYSFALFFYILLAQLIIRQPVNRLFTCLFIICLGISLGVVYELLEFAVDTINKPLIPGQASLVDTDLDLLADTVGAVIAAVQLAYTRLGRYLADKLFS